MKYLRNFILATVIVIDVLLLILFNSVYQFSGIGERLLTNMVGIICCSTFLFRVYHFFTIRMIEKGVVSKETKETDYQGEE